MTKSKIVQRLAEFGPPAIATRARPGPRCVLASSIGQMVLAEFGLDADPYVAEVTICNTAWVEWSKADYAGGADEQVRRGAHIITNRPNWNGGTVPSLNPPTKAAWDGHLALRLDDTLIDLDLGSFNRPTKGIVLPMSMVAALVNDQVCGEYNTGTGRGTVTHVLYRPLVASYAQKYLTSRDWTERERYDDMVEALVKRIREGRR